MWFQRKSKNLPTNREVALPMSFDKSGVKNPTIRSYILFLLGSWTTATGWTLKGDSILNCAHNCMRKVTAYCFYNLFLLHVLTKFKSLKDHMLLFFRRMEEGCNAFRFANNECSLAQVILASLLALFCNSCN